MESRESWDAIEAGLAGLRAHDVGPERAERIRARCLVALEAQRRAARARPSQHSSWRGWLEPAVALGCSAAYLAVTVGLSVHLASAVQGLRALVR
jgi:hypothetical protein